ncbi:MAG: hypothetical protein N2438_04675 [Limisphaera sp.]|nr:hypothetical protein [Limisphaera sp.]
MSLPSYFLVDLPEGAPLTPQLVADACHTLRRNRELYLAHRTTSQLIGLLAELGRNWLQPDDPFRQRALQEGPAHTGFSRATLERGLDAFFGGLTESNLRRLLRQDLGDESVLDAFQPAPEPSRRVRALGPRLLVQVAAGNLPDPTLLSIILGLLVRSAQFVKCASEGSFLPRLFGHSLRALDPKLAACLELAVWPGGRHDLEDVLLREGDCVVVTGEDATVASVRARTPVTARFLGYGHRVSFGFIAAGVLHELSLETLADRAAADVTAWDQWGCLSPHLFYVQTGADQQFPSQFAAALAAALERWETRQPRGPLRPERAALIAARRDLYAVRAACGGTTRIWNSAGSTAWTVVYEEEPDFQLSCLDRFVYVKPVTSLARALQAAEPVRLHVSTVGLAAPAAQQATLAEELAAWGVRRICPLGQMQRPPLTWHHDGRPALGDLVTWIDWECEAPTGQTSAGPPSG